MSGSSITLPAQLPPRTVMCPNCKRPGHSIEFCITPGGKMEGLFMQDAIDRQHVIRDNMRQHVKPREETNAPSNGTLLKLDNNGSVWIAGVHYCPDSKISAALANSEHPILDPDLDEYSDWPAGSSTDTVLNTSAILITSIDSTDVVFLSHPTNIPFFLDAGASSHISCVRSDFVTLKQLDEPHKISGVGNASVFAVGVSTIVLLLPQTNAQLQLHNVLFAPEACVWLISIHQLNKDGYTTTFQSGRCKLVNGNNTLLADCAPNSSNLYALPNAHAQTEGDHVALPSLVITPNLETCHRHLGHANHQAVLEMAKNGTTKGMCYVLA